MAINPPIDIPGTLPEDWELLIQMIQAMLPSNVDISSLTITSTGDLVNYLTGDKYVPIYTMREVLTGFAKVSGANPADTTNVAIRPITDIVPVAGGQVVKDIVSGKGSFGTVKKAVILSSLMALFVSTLTPAVSQHDYEEELLNVISDYTIDGENVLVYIDEAGKSHVSETLINGVREALVNLGTYAPAEPSIDPSNPFSVPNYHIYSLGVGESVTQQSHTYTLLSANEPVYFCAEVAKPNYPNESRFVFFSKGAFSLKHDKSTKNVALKNNLPGYNQFAMYTGTSTNVNTTSWVTPNDFYPDFYFGIPVQYVNPVTGTAVDTLGQNVLSYCALYDVVEAGGIEGVDVTGKSDFGDLSKTLEDAVQGLADRYTTLATPTDEDPFHKDKWYELNLNDIDVFEDGLTSDQTDPEQNTQGDVDDDTKDKIIEDLLNLIETITGTPDLPDIPAGDSGNTPPAEPPILNGSSNGLWAIYNPTLAEVHSFGAWLWSDSIIDQIIRQFNSPIDAIIGFHQIYCTPITGSPKTIKAGYLDSPVSAKEVTNQYVTINCGQIDVNEYYHTALDYNYSKLALYLPFVGIVPLDTAVCVGSTLEVIYRIDVLTGTCLAQVKVIKENSNAVMYTFPGNCAVQIPLTATTYTGMVGVLINGASAVGSFLSGNLMSAVRHGAHALASGLNNLTGTQQSGSLGSNAGALGIRKPYLIITHPVSYEATAYNTQYGYPINKTVILGSLSGYTKVKDIHLSGVPCTDDELEVIERLLKEGVIIN
jgi:hypothetical protein